MRFVSYHGANGDSYGLLLAGGDILDLPAAAELAGKNLPAAGMLAFIAAGEAPSPPRAAWRARPVNRGSHPRSAGPALADCGRRFAPLKNVFCVGAITGTTSPRALGWPAWRRACPSTPNSSPSRRRR